MFLNAMANLSMRIIINFNLYYEAKKPYNFLESDYVLKNKKTSNSVNKHLL